MSELTSLPSRDQALALEYVLGTLRGSERRAFAKQLARDSHLQAIVADWEETLMALPGPNPVPAPANSWANIEAALNRIDAPTYKSRLFTPITAWITAVAAICVLALGIWFIPSQPPAPAWRVSYVAVLTDEAGRVQLTALTQSLGTPPNAKNQLRLQGAPNSAGIARQVWAVAADGSVRSLAIFAADTTEPLGLTKEQWGLVKGAKELLLTEPSSDGQPGRVLAKGPCVQLVQQSVASPVKTL
jgi:anti-sigma-K factor RskA